MSSVKIISRCIDCKLDIFIDCLVNQNYDRLVVSGSATEEQKLTAWEMLYNEYRTISHLPSFDYISILLRDISGLMRKISVTQWNVHALTLGYFEDNVKQLQLIGFDVNLSEKTRDQLPEILNKVINISKSWQVELSRKLDEYEDYRKKSEGTPVTEMMFLKNLASLSAHFTTHLSPSVLTVAEYCAYVNLAMKHG